MHECFSELFIAQPTIWKWAHWKRSRVKQFMWIRIQYSNVLIARERCHHCRRRRYLSSHPYTKFLCNTCKLLTRIWNIYNFCSGCRHCIWNRDFRLVYNVLADDVTCCSPWWLKQNKKKSSSFNPMRHISWSPHISWIFLKRWSFERTHCVNEREYSKKSYVVCLPNISIYVCGLSITYFPLFHIFQHVEIMVYMTNWYQANQRSRHSLMNRWGIVSVKWCMCAHIHEWLRPCIRSRIFDEMSTVIVFWQKPELYLKIATFNAKFVCVPFPCILAKSNYN